MTDDRREQILSAAMRVFSQHGYHKASIKKIAQAADLKSTSHIYWYFEDKKALLSAVINELSPFRDIPLMDSDALTPMLDIPPQVLFTQIATGVLSLQDDPDAVAMLRLYLAEAFTVPEIADAISVVQRRMAGFLEAYLRHHIETGTLREHDVRSSARMLIGSIIIHLLGNQVFRQMAETFPPRDDYIHDVVTTLLHGLMREDNA